MTVTFIPFPYCPSSFCCIFSHPNFFPSNLVLSHMWSIYHFGSLLPHRSHFKEYLATEINENNLDPVDVMELNELYTVMGRVSLSIPPQTEQLDAVYKDNLRMVPHVSFLGLPLIKLCITIHITMHHNFPVHQDVLSSEEAHSS